MPENVFLHLGDLPLPFPPLILGIFRALIFPPLPKTFSILLHPLSSLAWTLFTVHLVQYSVSNWPVPVDLEELGAYAD